ncbi:hypothetical protein CON13_01735 [Bacillus cereus]|nr:hypothetical protein CON13_01735 [Bacillus cereus]PEE52060.1 hypothetical protein COM80_16575 [Bacillus cereus]PFL90906.1 hypothetical protein COJ35_24250 [Bacillus cereus]PFV69463.1 hypothetical protein COL16_18475 [Bacillus cereus]PGS34923.1 hypothetical protein COC56_16400 [Bacillus cereus]
MSLDDFFLEMAGVIGVTQKQLEDEFYMVDIARMGEIKRKQEALSKLELINIVNFKSLEDTERRDMVRRYMREAEIKPKEAKFDRDKFEELRALT